jgi:L-ascorbate metabolism protein UlaG (beta-lactamase superfamily)
VPTGDPPPLRITWLGHATVLLELDGARLLTDPVLIKRLMHLKRVAAPVDESLLSDLDAVLISHLHYDHLDLRSLRMIGRAVRIVVPIGAGEFLRERGFSHVTEVGVGGEVEIGGATIRPTPAEHGSKWSPFSERPRAMGYVVDGSARVYFAGDTDLFDGMSALAPLDVALLPVAGWGPRVPAGHLDPRRASQALTLLRPRVAVPVHWGTYRRIALPRSAEQMREPADEFVRLAGEVAPDVDVHVLPVGGTLELPTPLVPDGLSKTRVAS